MKQLYVVLSLLDVMIIFLIGSLIGALIIFNLNSYLYCFCNKYTTSVIKNIGIVIKNIFFCLFSFIFGGIVGTYIVVFPLITIPLVVVCYSIYQTNKVKKGK